MPKVTEDFLEKTIKYDELDDIIEKANLWQNMCVKDKTTPIRSGKKGCFIGIPDEHSGLPILRCPSFFECRSIPNELKSTLNLFSDKIDFNIIKIQKYIKGVEGISKHSDKCIDMEYDKPIYIYRLNKEDDKYRSLNFCEKENHNEIQTFKLKSNSLLEINYKENQKLLHWVPLENSDDITSECISFVLRISKTFQLESGHIYGQSAKYKTFGDRMKAFDVEPIDLRKKYDNVIKMYNIENSTDISEKKPKEYVDICDDIIDNTM